MKNISHAAISCLLLLALPWITSVALANSHAHREHGAHQHGAAQLNLALEGNVLQLELVSPAMNIVGFEHAPENPQQQQVLQEAMASLMRGAEVFALPAAARCRLLAADVDSELLEHHGEAHHGHESHTSPGHGEAMHADFEATYVFQCAAIDALRFVDVRLFALFAGMEEIDARLISEHGQSAVELTAQAVRIHLP